MTDSRVRSVADVNRMARSLIEAETLEQFFWLTGHVEGYTKSDRGHIYFRLSDEGKSVRCVLFEDKAGDLQFELRNALTVEVYGDMRFYEAWGNIEIRVLKARLTDGQRAEMPVVEQLRAEGLYPPAKRQPPERIRRIGIITSRSSRAIGDFENAYRTAADGITLPPYDFHFAFVEGDRAPQAISDAIGILDKDDAFDLIAIIRGGARSDALAIYDDIRIARAIIKCETFIVTGIGHHRDRTLADDLADHSLSTPTAVAHFISDLCARDIKPAPTASTRGETQNEARPPIGRISARLRIALIALAVAALWLVMIIVANNVGP